MKAYVEIRHPLLSACCGVIPAACMAFAATLFLPLLRGWAQVLSPLSIIGTAGLLWGLLGVQFRYRPFVVVMLVLGELAMLPACVWAVTHRSGSTDPMAWLIVCWLTFGPMLAGANIIYELWRGRLHQENML